MARRFAAFAVSGAVAGLVLRYANPRVHNGGAGFVIENRIQIELRDRDFGGNSAVRQEIPHSSACDA